MEEPSGSGSGGVKTQKAFCSYCQYPFKLLKIGTPSKHIAKCKKRKRATRSECKDGIQCTSRMESHYQLYSHTELADLRSEFPTPPSTQSSESSQGLVKQESRSSSRVQSLLFPIAVPIVDLTDSQTSSEDFSNTQKSETKWNFLKSSDIKRAKTLGKKSIQSFTTSKKLKPPAQKKLKSTAKKNATTSIQTVGKSKIKTPKKLQEVKIEKPITENPWSIAASQLKKRTPLKKIQTVDCDVIDLTNDDDTFTSPECITKSYVASGVKGKNLRRSLLTPSENRREENGVFTARPILNENHCVKPCSVFLKSCTESPSKNLENLSSNPANHCDLTKKVNDVGDTSTDQCDSIIITSTRGATSLKENLKQTGPTLQSTQITKERSNTLESASLRTDDSQDWSLPLLPRGPGFVPLSPIRPEGHSSLSSDSDACLDSDEEDIFLDIYSGSQTHNDANINTAKRTMSDIENENTLHGDKVVKNLQNAFKNVTSSSSTNEKNAPFVKIVRQKPCEDRISRHENNTDQSKKKLSALETKNEPFLQKDLQNLDDGKVNDHNTSLDLIDATLDDSLDDIFDFCLLDGLSEAQTLPYPKSTDQNGSGQKQNDATTSKSSEIPVCPEIFDFDITKASNFDEKSANIGEKIQNGATTSKSFQIPASSGNLNSDVTNRSNFDQKSAKMREKIQNGATTSKCIQIPVSSENLDPNVIKTSDFGSKISKNCNNLQNASIRLFAEPNKSTRSLPADATCLPETSNRKRQGDIGSMMFGMEPKRKRDGSVKKRLFDGWDGGKKSGMRQWGGGDGRKRTCPFYKKIAGTDIAVDAFSYGPIDGINFYFLTHFHSDHYMGLNRKTWKEKIYCSRVTGNLVVQKLRFPEEQIIRLPMWEETVIGNITVTLLEANHCPGAVLFLFKLANSQLILHTGDFRATEDMESYAALQGVKISTLHLDTTYLNSNYRFPLQSDVINAAVTLATRELRECEQTLFAVGTYLIGKERIFSAIAKAIGSRVFVTADKFRTVECIEDQELSELVTKTPDDTKVHVVAMRALNVKELASRLSKYRQFKKIVAFKPTGWTHNDNQPDLHRIKPVVSGSVKIYGLPYSEHSSFDDLRRFVQFLRPKRIIPTVNVGRKETREMMNRYLDKWKVGMD